MASVSPKRQCTLESAGDLFERGLALLDADADTGPQLPMGDQDDLQANCHFHGFEGEDQVCDCGISLSDYENDENPAICPAVLDALFDPLPPL